MSTFNFYKILNYPHPLLRQKCSPIEKFTPSLKSFIRNLAVTMLKRGSVGISAPQVGISKQVFLIDLTDLFSKAKTSPRFLIKGGSGLEFHAAEFRIYSEDINTKNQPIAPKFPMVFINPVVAASELSDPVKINWEGCLSFPNVPFYETSRFKNVTISAVDWDGKPFRMESCNLYASACCQHEVEHLDGILLIDKWKKTDYIEADIVKQIEEFEMNRKALEQQKRSAVVGTTAGVGGERGSQKNVQMKCSEEMHVREVDAKEKMFDFV